MTRPGMWRDESHDFNDLAGRVKRVEMATLANHLVSIEAVLPNSPSDGQDYYYSLPSGGQWHFRFNQLTGVWDFAGGPSIEEYLFTDTSYNSGTGGWSTSSALSLTLPFTGTYNFQYGIGEMYVPNPASNIGQLTLDIAGAGLEADTIAGSPAGAATGYGSPHGSLPGKACTAGDAVKLRCYATSGANVTGKGAYIRAEPVVVSA